MYTGPMCNFCEAAKRLFSRNNLKFNEIDIESTYCSETTDLIEDCYVCCNPNTISCTTEDKKIVYFQVEKTY